MLNVKEGVNVQAPMMSTEPFEEFLTKFAGPYSPPVAELGDSRPEDYTGVYFRRLSISLII